MPTDTTDFHVRSVPFGPVSDFTSDLKPLHYKCLVVIGLRFPMLVMFTTRPHFERDDGP